VVVQRRIASRALIDRPERVTDEIGRLFERQSNASFSRAHSLNFGCAYGKTRAIVAKFSGTVVLITIGLLAGEPAVFPPFAHTADNNVDRRLVILFLYWPSRCAVDGWGVVDRKSDKVALASTDCQDYVLHSFNKGWLRFSDVQVFPGNDGWRGMTGIADH